MPADQLITCSRCKETIQIEDGSCSHCGKNIRGDLPYIAVAGLGLLLLGATLLDPGDLLGYGILGLFLAVGAGYFLYEKRQRIKDASRSN